MSFFKRFPPDLVESKLLASRFLCALSSFIFGAECKAASVVGGTSRSKCRGTSKKSKNGRPRQGFQHRTRPAYVQIVYRYKFLLSIAYRFLKILCYSFGIRMHERIDFRVSSFPHPLCPHRTLFFRYTMPCFCSFQLLRPMWAWLIMFSSPSSRSTAITTCLLCIHCRDFFGCSILYAPNSNSTADQVISSTSVKHGPSNDCCCC